MKNKLTDLNNHLFMVLERLNDEDISQDQLEKEIIRANSVSRIAKSITESAELIFSAKKYCDEMGVKMSDTKEVPDVLRITDEKQ